MPMRKALGVLTLGLAACAPQRLPLAPAPLVQHAAIAPMPVIALQPGSDQKVDHIVVHKAARTLLLYAKGALVGQITGIQLGAAPVGPKHFQGDRRTPEGHYTLDYGNPASAYHLSLHISYPSAADAEFARGAGRAPGGDVFIHGQPNDWRHAERVPGDWTDGCIALSNAEVEMLWARVAIGTPIDIEP